MSDAPMTDEAVLRLRQEREAFIERVRKNESLAASDPVRYRRKLRNLVLLAYGYIALLLLLCLALGGGVVWMFMNGWRGSGLIKLGLIAVVMLFAILRSLFVKIARPDGLLVTRARAPRLWEEVEAIADRLKAPRPDEIRLNEEFNASAAQWPRFGVFGGYRSTLSLGLPLLASLGHDEARGVIAHEFGHFSGEHGRFGVWIYRVHATWAQLTSGRGDSAAGSFWKWFGPRFAATSFALRRQHEYEADRAAAEVVGAKTIAGTLSRLDALGEHQQKAFWGPFDRSVERGAMPANGFFSTMAETLRQPLDHDAANRRLAFALAEPTDYDDSHPSLTDRLRSLGESAPAEIAPIPQVSAAEAFFGDDLPAVAADLEAYYAAKMTPFWSQLATRRTEMETRRAALERETATRPPSEDEAIELAYLRARFAEPEEAREIYRTLRESLPENATAAFFLGQVLADEDDPECEPLLRFAAERDPEIADAARSALAAFLARQGDHATYSRIREEAQEAYDRQRVAENASAPTLKDEFLTPDLKPEEIERIRQSLERFKGLGRAYAFRKRLPGTGELRDYLFLVPGTLSLAGNDPLEYFMKQFGPDTDLARPFMIVANPHYKAWENRLKAVPGTLAYDKKAK